MEAEFTPLTDKDGTPTVTRNITFSDWLEHTYLSTGSLLARSCSAAMQLAQHSKEHQDAAFSFGENITYAHQVRC